MTAHDPDEPRPAWFKPQPMSPAAVYDAVTIKDLQRTLQVPETGEMDERTVSHIKGLQHVFGIPASGVIDLATAVQIERIRNRYAIS